MATQVRRLLTLLPLIVLAATSGCSRSYQRSTGDPLLGDPVIPGPRRNVAPQTSQRAHHVPRRDVPPIPQPTGMRGMAALTAGMDLNDRDPLAIRSPDGGTVPGRNGNRAQPGNAGSAWFTDDGGKSPILRKPIQVGPTDPMQKPNTKNPAPVPSVRITSRTTAPKIIPLTRKGANSQVPVKAATMKRVAHMTHPPDPTAELMEELKRRNVMVLRIVKRATNYRAIASRGDPRDPSSIHFYETTGATRAEALREILRRTQP